MVLLCCFSAVSASENVTDDIAVVSDDVAVDEVVVEVDSADDSIAVENDESLESVDDSINESLAVQDDEQTNDVKEVDSALATEDDNGQTHSNDVLGASFEEIIGESEVIYISQEDITKSKSALNTAIQNAKENSTIIIRPDTTITRASASYPNKNITIVGENRETVLITSHTIRSGDVVNQNNTLTWVNVTFSCSIELSNTNYKFINCTFINSPLQFDGARSSLTNPDVYNYAFENCEFVNYTQTNVVVANKFAKVSILNCAFDNVTADAIVSTNANRIDDSGRQAGVTIKDSTFNDVAVKGIVKAQEYSVAAVTTDNRYDFAIQKTLVSDDVVYIDVPVNATILTVSVADISEGEDFTIEVTLSNNLTANVSVVINQKEYNVSVVNGTGSLKVTDKLAVNTYDVESSYAGEYPYAASTNTTTFKVEKVLIEYEVIYISQDDITKSKSALNTAIQNAKENTIIIIRPNTTITRASSTYSAIKNITIVGEDRETVLVTSHAIRSGSAVNQNNTWTWVNVTFSCSIDLSNTNYKFINCTFINSPLQFDGARSSLTNPDVYNYAFENCEFVNYTQNNVVVANKFAKVSILNCAFDNVTADAIVSTNANRTDDSGRQAGVTIKNSTFKGITVKGIVKAQEYSVAAVTTDNIYDFAIQKTLASGDVVYIDVPGIATILTVSVADISEGEDFTIEVTLSNNLTANVSVVINQKEYTVSVVNGTGSLKVTDKLTPNTYVVEASYAGEYPYAGNANTTTFKVIRLEELTNVVTNATFFKYFDNEGNLLDDITFDELIFQGNFSDLVDVITFPRAINLTSDNAVLENISIKIAANDVNLTGFTLNANNADFTENNGAAILITGDDVTVSNVLVNYVALKDANSAGTDSYGIYAKGANGFKLLSSEIGFDSNSRGYSHQYALHIANSDDVVVRGNLINGTFISCSVDFGQEFGTIYTDCVLSVGIQAGENGLFESNDVYANVKGSTGSYSTLDCMMVCRASNLVISNNNFTETDTHNVDVAGYCNVVDLYQFNNIAVEYNNITVVTTTGVESAGSAYPIQATGPYDALTIIGNNLTGKSKGPALGIYSQCYDGGTNLTVIGNYINITGLATGNSWALVSGMEFQDSYVKVYNNTIYSYSIGSYDDDNCLYGISYRQKVAGDHFYDIQNNTIYTEGKYAIYLLNAADANITENNLYAHDLMGDDAAIINDGNGIIENNRPAPARLVVAADNITVGQTAVINVTLEDGANGAVNLIVNGKSYTVDIVDGQGQVTVDGLAASDYTAAAYFEPSDIYFKSSENSTVFNVAKLETAIAIDVINATLGEDATVVVTIPNATGSVKVIVNGKEESLDLEDGQATYVIEDIAAGDYNIVAFYAGDKNNDAASNSTIFTVAKLTPEIVVDVPAVDYGSDAVITIEIANATGNVFVDVGANKYYAELENGVATVTVPKVTENATVAVKYAGDDKYEANTASAELIVNKITTVLSGEDLNMAYKDGAWTVTLTDAEGNAIANVPVNVGINVNGVDKVYSRVTDADGVASLPINLAPGSYAVNATYDGDDKYVSAFVNATVTVTKAAAVLSSEDLVMTYKNGTWSVTLTDTEGNAIANAAVKIGITVNGVEKVYNRKTDAEGVAGLPINVAPGEYAVSATFEGNNKFESAFVNATVTVAKNALTISAEDLTMTYKDGSSYKVNVVDAEGNAVADINVKITVKGKDYNVKSNSEGVAELPINLVLGNYTVTAAVADAVYESNEISNAISVTTDNLAIAAGDVNMTYKDGTAYEVQLVDAEGNPVALANQIVKVTVKGKTYDRKTNADGIASLTINLGAGTYDITAEYNGIELNNTVTVVKA